MNSNSTIPYLDSVTYVVISVIFVKILMVILCLMAKVYRKLKKNETDDGYEEDVIETGKPKYD